MQKKQLTPQEVNDVLQQLNQYLSDLKSRWDAKKINHKGWWRFDKTYLGSATDFIINCLEELVIFVERIIPEGTEKKAAVLMITSKLFDYIVVQAFPIWLKPFSAMIKGIIMVIVSGLIDYIVGKYNAGFWKMEGTNNGTETQKSYN